MEGILYKLLNTKNETIQQGTRELKEAFQKNEAIPALCDIIVSCSNPQIRQSAAVLLKRKLGKKKQWIKLDQNFRTSIKHGLLKALLNEQENVVKNSIAQLIGTIGKHEIPDNTWPELFDFIHNLSSSDNLLNREMAMFTLYIMTDISSISFMRYVDSFIILFTNTLSLLNILNKFDSNLAFYTVGTMNHLVCFIGTNPNFVSVYQTLLPRILKIITAFSSIDEKRACELFTILEELIEFASVVILPHMELIINMCLQVSIDNGISSDVRIKAISVIGWLVRSKPKVIQKFNLINPIIDVLIQLMAQKPEDEGNEEYFMGDPDQFTTITVATQTLDLMALNIPSEKVIPYLLTVIEPAINSQDIYAQKAGYLSLAVLAEGCSEKIRQKYLESFLKCVCNAIHNTNTVVRNAAFFALGQFAEHLQPEINQYATELLPILFKYIEEIFIQMENDKNEPPSLDRLFYAVETLCDNLNKDLLPFLPTLMERIFISLNPNGWSLQLKRMALSILGSTASSVKDELLPYFPKILELLNIYIISEPNTDNNTLQCYAIEALALIAQYIGNDNFKPLANDSLQLGLRLMTNTDDPDLKKSIYSLFSSLANVMKEDIGPALPQIVNEMINSVQSSEGIVSHYNNVDSEEFDVYGNLSDDDNDDNDDNNDNDNDKDITDTENGSYSTVESCPCRYSVENSYNDEKEQACIGLKEICSNTGSIFLPYIDKCFEEVFKLINYPQDDIRKVSVETILQFCITLYQINQPNTKQALYKGLQMFVPKCSELIRSDEEHGVVICCLEAYSILLKELKSDVLVGEGHREAIVNCVIDVLTLKTICQDNGLGAIDGYYEDADAAEQDEILLESACVIIPHFGNSITPEDFSYYFSNIFQLLSMRTKKNYSHSQRSFSYGTLAECMKCLDIYVEKYVPVLFDLWINGLKDINDEVRNNAVFGLGEMILNGKHFILPYYTKILNKIVTLLTNETNNGIIDNIIGCFSKMIIINSNLIPLENIFPLILKNLPLKTDYEENNSVIKCLFLLYQQGCELLKINLPKIIEILIHIYLKNESPNNETAKILIDMIQTISIDFSDTFANVVSVLNPDDTNALKKLFA